MKRFIRSFTLVFSCFLMLAGIGSAQETTGNIEGTVKDATGAVVPNASVTIRSFRGTTDNSGVTTTGTSQGFNRTVSADSNGFFRVLQVPPGLYNITTAPVAGFGEARYENVQVVLGKTTQLDIELKVGAATATVDVGASDQPIDTTDNEVSTSLNAQKLELIPKGQDFSTALKTIPGTRPEPAAGGFTIDGATNAENVFVIDGQEVTNYKDAGINKNNLIPFQLIQELTVKSSGFDAEFGGATGGVINVATKGGNNDFHGEFGVNFTPWKWAGANRPTLLRFPSGTGANFVQPVEYFTQPKQRRLDSSYTATLSGPIIKDKVWFFGSWTPQTIEQNLDITFYTNAPAATRVINTAAGVNGRDTYYRRTTYNYGFGRIDAQPWSTLRLTGTYLWNPVVRKGSLSFLNEFGLGGVTTVGTAQFGFNDNNPIDFGGNVGVLQGSELRRRQGGRDNGNNITAQAIWTPLTNLVTSFRFSRGFLNERGDNYLVPTGVTYSCAEGNTPQNTISPDACTRGFVSPSTQQNVKDVSIRTNYEGDATFLFSAGGRHELKGGYQHMKIFNDLLAGFQATAFLCYGNYRINSMCATLAGQALQNSNATPNPNAIGAGVLQRIGRVGQGSNLNQAIYIQDKYQPMKRLTLNLGVRIEKEDIPSYNQFPASFSFGWKDKVAPRLGFAYDVFGNGNTKVFGSYGKFFDRLKFHLAQGAFGGDFYRLDYFDILPNSGPFTNFTVESIVGNFTDPIGGDCPTNGFIGSGLSRCQRDLRIASNDPTADPVESGAIDPNSKPYQQREFTFGVEHGFGKDYVLRARYTDKKLINAIEDAGVSTDNGEVFITGNPGQGLHQEFLQAAGYEGPYPTPRRSYRALELVLEKRLSDNYFFNVNYTYSRLRGNYSGLVNTEELGTTGASLNGLGRSSPGVNRNFDLPFIGFTAAGGFDDGPLPTDRPHVLNAYGAYIFDWWKNKANSTEFTAFQTFQSGTPQTTYIQFGGATTIFTGRNDLGRTEMLSQTDFGITHRYRFGRDNRFTLVGDVNILNLFDQKNVLTLQNTLTNGQIATTHTLNASCNIAVSAAFPQFVTLGPIVPGPNGTCTRTQSVDDVALVNAYNRGDLLSQINTYLQGTPTILNRTRSDYDLANRFQGPRTVRFGFRLIF